jgi:hypothetical protein
MDNIRAYRINFQNNFINHDSDGIALFDLIGTFIVAYLLNLYLKVSNSEIYYLSVLPLAVLVHLMVGKNTFLNQHLFSKDFNIYKLIFSLIFTRLFYIKYKKFI